MMRSFSRSSVVVAALSLTTVVAVVVLCAVGILGLNASSEETRSISEDEVATIALGSRFATEVDRAYTTGLALALGVTDQTLAHELYDERIPAAEALLAKFVQQHEDEPVTEQRAVAVIARDWAALRRTLNDWRLGTGDATIDAGELRARYGPLSTNLQELIADEAADAGEGEASTSTHVSRTTRALIAMGTAAVVAAVVLGLLAHRRIRHEVEPAQEQADFADTLQLAQDEEEAHQLLQRRLSRVIPDGSVTILNRNNSADRLEPMTPLAPGSGLAVRLEDAEPRACLAIRSARPHDEDPRRSALLGCQLCRPCDGFSTCTPLTVGGEVIGSVLMNRSRRYGTLERRQVHEAVSQSAPVLANLRNLAIAEFRAATDALTGLPNKRAVTDTLRRMFAQASRTVSPMALVLLDLDHFKQVNDRFGHHVGDQALAGVGAALRSTLRDADFAGRSGGEEFAVILPNTDVQGALVAAEKLRTAIAETTVPGTDLELTVSLGVAVYPDHALSPERLERLADAALYVAKRSGRNRVEVATVPIDMREGPGPAHGGPPRAVTSIGQTTGSPVRQP